MAEWYVKGDMDQGRLSRILDVAQDLKAGIDHDILCPLKCLHLKGRVQERPLDFSAIFESAQKKLNFAMWVSFHLRNTALKFFLAGLLFVFEILRMQTTLSFPSGIFWRSIVKRKTKETFCFAKGSSDYNTIDSHCCFVSSSG